LLEREIDLLLQEIRIVLMKEQTRQRQDALATPKEQKVPTKDKARTAALLEALLKAYPHLAAKGGDAYDNEDDDEDEVNG
jgi:hypothetical protein